MSVYRKKGSSLLLILLLSVTMIFQGLFPAVFAASMAETPSSDFDKHWAKEAIETALKAGIATGYPDGTFKPNEHITRAEFFSMINKAFELEAMSEEMAYSDIQEGQWYVDAINRAVAAQFVSGYPDGTIRPDNHLTRQEVAVIMTKLHQFNQDSSSLSMFADAAKIPAWSSGYVGAVAKAGLMKGYPDKTFMPQGLITRAEAVVVVQKSMAAGPKKVDQVISISEIPVVSLPEEDTPVTMTIIETAEYTGIVTWIIPDEDAEETSVTKAIIEITPKRGFTLRGVPENFFTLEGAITTNEANSGVVTAEFELTAEVDVIPLAAPAAGSGGGGGGSTQTTTKITTYPTASDIFYGQALSASKLTGGKANTQGTFAFKTPAYVPTALGTYRADAVFTPTSARYSTVEFKVDVLVKKANPTITTYPQATAITLGQSIGTSSLTGGVTSVAGTFAFASPGTIPVSTGTYAASVIFTPTDTTHYNTVTTTVGVMVNNKTTPTISVKPTASAITYGQSLSDSALSGGTASVSGTFAFATPAYNPSAGIYAATVVFTPSNSELYNTASTTVNVAVAKATPTITVKPTTSAITYGQTLASSTLSGGTASVPGSFAFTSPGTVLNAGVHPSVGVTFTPTDTSNYNTVFTSVSVTVNKATPVVTTWPTASAITYGQTLGDATLSGGIASVAGSFAFTTPTTKPNAGTADHPVIFTPTDMVNYNTATADVSVTVNKATPVITTWPTAGSLTYGQTLADASLSGGVAVVTGTFAFTSPTDMPMVGTADHEVTFTPDDGVNYNTATAMVSVTVGKALPVLTPPAATAITLGQTLAASTLSGGSATANGLAVSGTFAFVNGTIAPGEIGPYEADVMFTPDDTGKYETPAVIKVTLQVYAAPATKAKLLFTFDDGWKDTLTNAKPVLDSAGFKATVYVNRNMSTSLDEYYLDTYPGILRPNEINTLYLAGWDIGNHTTNHRDYDRVGDDLVEFATRTDSEALAEMREVYLDNQKWLLGHDLKWVLEGDVTYQHDPWVRGAFHTAYPSGLWSTPLIDLLKNIGVQTGRLAGYGYEEDPASDPIFSVGDTGFYHLPVFYAETEPDGADWDNLKDVKDAIDAAVTGGKTLILMVHRVQPTKTYFTDNFPGQPTAAAMDDMIVTTDNLQAMVDYAKGYVDGGTLDVVTFSQWYASMGGTPTAQTITHAAPIEDFIVYTDQDYTGYSDPLDYVREQLGTEVTLYAGATEVSGTVKWATWATEPNETNQKITKWFSPLGTYPGEEGNTYKLKGAISDLPDGYVEIDPIEIYVIIRVREPLQGTAMTFSVETFGGIPADEGEVPGEPVPEDSGLKGPELEEPPAVIPEEEDIVPEESKNDETPEKESDPDADPETLEEDEEI